MLSLPMFATCSIAARVPPLPFASARCVAVRSLIPNGCQTSATHALCALSPNSTASLPNVSVALLRAAALFTCAIVALRVAQTCEPLLTCDNLSMRHALLTCQQRCANELLALRLRSGDATASRGCARFAMARNARRRATPQCLAMALRARYRHGLLGQWRNG